MSVTLYGNRLVVYSKKVLVVLDLKSIPYNLNTEAPKEYEKIDEDIVKSLYDKDFPEIFSYLESQLKATYLVGDIFSIADISIGSAFINGMYAGLEIDSSKYPRLMSYLENIFKLLVFQKMIEEDYDLFKGLDIKPLSDV